MSLPYINKISEITARILKKHNVEVAHKPTSKFKSMFNKHKDHRKPLDRNNVIYKIPCQDCEQVYISETSKTANTRITEHKNATRREDSRSLPATHVINHNHRFDWTKTTILDNGTTRKARELKEAWHSLQNPAINTSTSQRHTHTLHSKPDHKQPITLPTKTNQSIPQKTHQSTPAKTNQSTTKPHNQSDARSAYATSIHKNTTLSPHKPDEDLKHQVGSSYTKNSNPENIK